MRLDAFSHETISIIDMARHKMNSSYHFLSTTGTQWRMDKRHRRRSTAGFGKSQRTRVRRTVTFSLFGPTSTFFGRLSHSGHILRHAERYTLIGFILEPVANLLGCV
jgi:hypothetical protein